MAYATPADFVRAYGEDFAATVSGRDGSGNVDTAVIERKLVAATSLIDTHLRGYQRPIADPPPFLQQYCIDIAAYWAANSADLVSTEMRQRYEDALKHLTQIADGKADLGTLSPSVVDDVPTAVAPVVRAIMSERG